MIFADKRLLFRNKTLCATMGDMSEPSEQPTAFFYGHVAKDGETPTHTFDGVDYVGAILPPLPEWDKTLCPYAVIGICDTSGKYALVTVPSGLKMYDEYTWVNKFYDIDGTLEVYFENGEWVHYNKSIWIYPLWANFNVLNRDGTLHFAAIDPIPIYE